MTSFRPSALGLVGLSVALCGGATAWLAGTDAAVASATPVRLRIQPNGFGFSMHSVVEATICVKDTPPRGNPASEVELSSARPATTRTGPSPMLPTFRGDHRRNGRQMPRFLCHPSMHQCHESLRLRLFTHFTYGPRGQIKSTSGTQCLEAEAASQGGEMFSARFKKGFALQVFMRTRKDPSDLSPTLSP
jgi:hypothetical protein